MDYSVNRSEQKKKKKYDHTLITLWSHIIISSNSTNVHSMGIILFKINGLLSMIELIIKALLSNLSKCINSHKFL